MALILIIDALAIGWLISLAARRGLEATLPSVAFLIVLFPVECQISLPGLFDLTTQRLIIIVLIALYAFAPKGPAKKPLPMKFLILALMAWMMVSAVNSVVVAVSIKTVLSEFFDFFVVYYIFAKVVTKVETVHKILFAFVAGMFVCSCFGFLEIYYGWSVTSLFPAVFHRFASLPGVEDRGGRVQSTFGHPILFGGGLAMAVPMALYLISTAKETRRKLFLWAAVMLMFLNIYKTMSRGPWMAAVLSSALILVCGGKQMRRYLAVISLLAAITLVLRPGVWDTIRNLYGETLNPDTAQGASYQWRYALYEIGVQHLNNDLGRALWGYGPESFFFLGWQGNFQGALVKFDSCDSSVAALMIETGYVGLLLVAAVLCKTALHAYAHLRRIGRPSNLICVVFLANILAFGFLMTNVAILGWGQQTYMLWALLALTMTYPEIVLTRPIPDDQIHVRERRFSAAINAAS